MANYLENKKDVILMNEKILTQHEPNASAAKVSKGSERKKSEKNLNNYGALDLKYQTKSKNLSPQHLQNSPSQTPSSDDRNNAAARIISMKRKLFDLDAKKKRNSMNATDSSNSLNDVTD